MLPRRTSRSFFVQKALCRPLLNRCVCAPRWAVCAASPVAGAYNDRGWGCQESWEISGTALAYYNGMGIDDDVGRCTAPCCCTAPFNERLASSTHMF